MKLTKKDKRILLSISLVAIIIRCIFLNGKTGDYTSFLKPWLDIIKSYDGFYSLKYSFADYNVPYLVILCIISTIKCNSLYLIKFISIIFDFVCAIYGFKIINKLTNNKITSMIGYAVILFLPTVIINGALWGQCDSIYTAFILISLYYLCDKKYIRSFIFLGISFAFKLQFIFVLPLYIVLFFRDKNIKWYYFLILPLVNFIMCLPAIVMGRDIVDVMMIYVNQTSTYIDLELNFPNIYVLLEKDIMFAYTNNEIICRIGIIFTMFIYFIMWLYTLLKKVKFNSEKIINFAIWSIMIATYFLPRMHERYLFVADILTLICFLLYKKNYYIVLSVNIISIITYFRFLFGFNFISYEIISILYFIVIFIYTRYIFKLLGEENEVRKR